MFSNLNLATRLAFAFASLLTLITLLGATALWKMQGLAANTTYFVENIVPSLEVQHQISAGLADIRRLQYMHVASNSETDMDKVETDMVSVITQFDGPMITFDDGRRSHHGA